jgi:hypothetical protein
MPIPTPKKQAALLMALHSKQSVIVYMTQHMTQYMA